jgi:hypothetical protein
MWLFILGVFPLLLCMALCAAPPDAGAFRVKALSSGVFFGAAVCAAQALFVFPAREIRADFFALFWEAYAARFFSLFILGALFFLVFKGSPRGKADSLFFLFAPYFAIAVPYRALSLVSPAGFFELCAAPLMYAFLTADIALASRAAFNAQGKKKRAAAIAAFLCGGALAVAFICAAETSRGTGGRAYALITALFIALSAVFLLASKTAARHWYDDA